VRRPAAQFVYHRLRRGALITAVVSVLAACAANPVTGEQDFVLMSEEQEISLGRKYSAEIIKEMPPYEHPELARLVQEVGEKLAANSHRPELIYRFTVLDSTSVNAFALPGGYIYITRGLLAYLNSEAELAAVLGHEIGHVTARHSVRQQSTATVAGILGAVVAASTGVQGVDTLANLAGTAIVRGYGREHELEADRLGAGYLARSGYDPQGMLQVVRVLKDQETFDKQVAELEDREPRAYHGLFATHPDNDTRLQEVIAAAGPLQSPASTQVERDSFLQALDGMTFGAREAEGILRGNRLYHKDLDFSLSFPTGWRIDNQAERIVAASRDNDGILQVTVADLNKRITPREFMLQRLHLENMRDGKDFTAGGFQGYTATADGNTPWGVRAVRYAVIFRDTRAWVFAGAAKGRENTGSYHDATLATASSYRPLGDEERALASEERLKIITVPAGTRYADLARTSPIANYPEQQLRLLNGDYPDGEPEAARRLKVVH
jgi:predicted Zn-dependent protease